MYTDKKIIEQLKKLIKNSTNDTCKIIFDDGFVSDYHISFNFDIEGFLIYKDDSQPLVKISDFQSFASKVITLVNLMAPFYSEYKDHYGFTEENYLDYLLISIFSNMNEYDFNNTLNYLDRIIDSYQQNYSFYKDKLVGKINVKGKEISIYETCLKSSASMEAPLYKQYIFSCEGDVFYSPKVRYYISQNKCYVMAIQNNPNKQNNILAKLLDRYFRKLDKGLAEYERSENNQIETPKDISPTALATLTIFVSSTKETSTFCFPDYLPLRYTNKLGTLKTKSIDYDEADRIQANLTNKLLFTGIRLCEHFTSSSISFDTPNYLEIEFNPLANDKNNIIFDLYDAITQKKQIKNK